MAVRMTSTQVVFRRPFVLHGFDSPEPAGTYTVETEEESIDDVSVPAWKRLATIMHVTRAGATEYVRIEPEELRQALARDGGPEESPSATAARLETARRPRRDPRLALRRKF